MDGQLLCKKKEKTNKEDDKRVRMLMSLYNCLAMMNRHTLYISTCNDLLFKSPPRMKREIERDKLKEDEKKIKNTK